MWGGGGGLQNGTGGWTSQSLSIGKMGLKCLSSTEGGGGAESQHILR